MALSNDMINIDQALRQLSLEEKISLLSGSKQGRSQGLPEYGIPELQMSDGPTGVRGAEFFNPSPACCLPCGTALGATFDEELVQHVGELIGDEAKSKSVQVMLGPTICLQRSPLIGRGFEAYGEDPVLSGQLGAAYINGLQDRGVAACLKHYVAHDQSWNSTEDSIWMSQRTLREVHTMPFQYALKSSNPWSIMSAYHKINGIHCSEHWDLLTGILKEDWGYDNLIISDWSGTYSTSEAINAGLDLEMPTEVWRGSRLSWVVNARKVTMQTVDNSVRRLLTLINRVAQTLSTKKFDNNTAATRALARKVAADAIVLLKNEADILPLPRSGASFALIGDHWMTPAIGGGGSAEVRPPYIVTPFNAFVQEVGKDAVVFQPGCYSHKFAPLLRKNIYQPESNEPGMTLDFYDKDPLKNNDAKLWHSVSTTRTLIHILDSFPEGTIPDDYFLRIRGVFKAPKSMIWRFGLCCAGKAKLYVDGKEVIDLWTNQPEKIDNTPVFNFFSMEKFANIQMMEGQEYHLDIHLVNQSLGHVVGAAAAGGVRIGGFEAVDEDSSIAGAVAAAKQVDIPIIMTGLGPDYEYEGCDRKHLKLPGRIDELIQRVVAANPNTVVITESGCAIEMPWVDTVKTLVHAWMGGQETGNSLADVLFGRVNPSGRLSMTFPRRLEDTPAFLNFSKSDYEIWYGEGVFIGHRYYEKLKTDPLFYFGHGLSYTQFQYSDLIVPPYFSSDPKHVMNISVRLANIGRRAGAEVVQVYVCDLDSSIQRPARELKAFKKVRLAAGESRVIHISLDKYALSFWSDEDSQWKAEAGKFAVIIAASANPQSELLRTTFDLSETFLWKGL